MELILLDVAELLKIIPTYMNTTQGSLREQDDQSKLMN
jgi:hypothetical protein